MLEIIKQEPFPVLYILMRTDLTSLNCGKACAQASHATSLFHEWSNTTKKNSDIHDYNKEMISTWKKSAGGFGTVITLGVNELEMRLIHELAFQQEIYPCSIVHDPTYPIVDGKIVHQIPLDTCAYIFGDKNNIFLKAILKNFSLHP